MSFRRKTYDANFTGGSAGTSEWGNSFDSEVKANKYASAKRTRRVFADLDNDDHLPDNEGEKDRYLITYADLLTLLLGLFIILYAISNIDIKKYESMMAAMGDVFGTQGKVVGMPKGGLIKNAEPLERNLSERIEDLIRENNYGGSISLVENERGITIRILDDILFPSGKAEISPGSKTILRKITQVIKELPNDIRVEGHTDNVPINNSEYASNWHLSVQRATNTAYFLMNQEGMLPEKVSIVGYSEYKPVASNASPDGRALNRRVDIVILNQK